MSLSDAFISSTNAIYQALPDGPPRDLWSLAAERLSPILTSLLVLSVVVGLMTRMNRGSRARLSAEIAVALILAGGIVIFRAINGANSGLHPAILFYCCVATVPLALGLLIGMHLRHNVSFRWYFLAAGIPVLLLYFVTSPKLPGVPAMKKEELRASWLQSTGLRPEEKDKKAFWKAVTGEETPAESRKNEFWNGKKK